VTLRTNRPKFQPLPPRPSQPRTPTHITAKPVDLKRDAFNAVMPPVKKAVEFALDKLLPKKTGDQRTPADAVREADELLRGPAVDVASEGTAQTIRDAANVNDSRDTNAESTRHQAALEQLEANEALEAAALKKLSPAEQKQYEAVKQRCLDANDPVAALALEKLLLDGKLPGAKDLRGEGTTLDHLAKLADEKTPLAEGIDRDQLVTDLVQELATPSSIRQGERGTCAPTTIAIQLAMNDPAEYARIAAGLASPEGTVTLAGGQTITREEGTAAPDATTRSVTQRLIGSAFMELANGESDYQNESGEGAGAWSDKLDVLYEAVTGRKMSDQRLTTDEQRADAMEIIDTQLRAGATVPVALSWGDGYHKVLVTGTETIDGKEYVTYTNPWGREERIPREDFEKRLADISYDPRAQLVGTILQGVDTVKDLLGRVDPKDLLADVRLAQLASVKL
jgi:hypothetical protein